MLNLRDLKSAPVWSIPLVLLVVSSALPAGGRRRGHVEPLPVPDPVVGTIPPWLLPYESTWGPGVTAEAGYWAPVGGSWDDLLKTGPTLGIGTTWKYADWSGDLLPPSSTHFSVDYRYSRFKGDHDVQLYAPGGIVADVNVMRMYLLEAGVTQRFGAFLGGHGFVDVGTVFGLGAADGELSAALPDPTKDALWVSRIHQDGIVFRGGLNTGVGLQYDWCEIRFSLNAGLSGSNALANGLRSQGDFGMRLGGTIYLY